MGMTVLPFPLKSPDELDSVFAALAAQHPDLLQIVADSAIIDLHDRIAALALAHRLPGFSNLTNYAKFGGLMSYGISLEALFIRATYFVKRILDGAKPGDLPVEQLTKIVLGRANCRHSVISRPKVVRWVVRGLRRHQQQPVACA
jgi:putative tryptophan/tyrosine transport system substrate-binding protein